MKELDISEESFREYVYKDTVYRIEKPMKLFIKEGGTGHRVVDAAGVTHWCPVNVLHCILSTKHCQHIENRKAYEECRQEFLK